MATNLNNISISADGRVSFSGVASNIDFRGAVDAIIEARRIPVDRIETQVETNKDKIEAMQTLRGGLNALQESLRNLYGAVTIDNSRDIFSAKQAFASASREDGATASQAGNLLGVSVTARAAAGNHSIEVMQTARAHRVGSDLFSAANIDLASARGLPANSISGTITIGGREIEVTGSDTLADLASKINNANSGTDASGVSASVVSISATEKMLVMTTAETGKTIGTDIALDDPDGILSTLGVLNPGGGFANELQSARTAKFYADGVLDPAKYATTAQPDATTPFGLAGNLSIRDGAGNLVSTIAYDASTTMQGLRDAIAADPALAAAGITASIDSSDDGQTLRLAGTAGFTVSDDGDLASSLGLARERLLLERSSNTIDDLFQGVTLTLFQAEPGTTIDVAVENDLSQVKSAISGFVEAYNAVRQFMNTQLDIDPTTGEKREDAVLFGSSTLSDIEQRLGDIIGTGASGASDAFTVLAQIGVTLVDNSGLSDPTLADTLELSDEKLDEALLNNADEVRRLFTFGFSSSNPQVSLVRFTGETSFQEGGYSLDLDMDGDALAGATIAGGTAEVDGRQITVTDGPAKGLRLYYSGSGDTSLDFQVSAGVGSKMFFELDRLLDTTSGPVENEIRQLDSQNRQSQTRIEDWDRRLEYQREKLLERFVNMETALATMNNTMESLKQMIDANSNSRN